jgi:taurine dioxygenase
VASASDVEGELTMHIVPTGQTLGARVLGVDLSRPIDTSQVDALIVAVCTHGVLEFPEQELSTEDLRRFSAYFGELHVSPGGRAQVPGFPEVMVLSNKLENGQPVGLGDAGQSWHTDMSYMDTIAFANCLYGIEIPYRDGRALGDTQFRNTRQAYDELPDEVKQLLEGKTVTHDFNKFWDLMRSRPGSRREPLSAAERAKRPPATHPAVLEHPVTGRKVLYVNPGYAIRINELEPDESDRWLNWLFSHQEQPQFHFSYSWKPRSVLLWDNIGTNHNAVADYGPHEIRYIKRCQIMATRLFGAGGTRDPIRFSLISHR